MKNFTFENLSFYYGKKIVLNNISFTINSNDVVALVGPNGVGKTTLLNIISHKIDSVSYLKDDPGFYPYLSGEENLKAFDLIIENKFMNTKDALEIVNLQCDKDKKYKKYSLGMKKRLGIAKCLLKNSDIYLFDEPLNGLDAKSIILFRDIIRLLKDNGKTVIISSHILGELNIYCNKILYLNSDGYLFSDLNKEKTIEDIFKGDLYEK